MAPTLRPMSTRIAKWAAYAALGPITGPLVAGYLRNRKSAPLLSGLYLVAIPTVWLGLSSTLGLLRAFSAP